MTLVVAALVTGGVLGFAWGQVVARRREREIRLDAMEEAYERGRAVGGDELSDALFEAAAARPDPLDAWPRERTEGRPQ